VTLLEARDHASALHRLIRQGVDPLAAKRRERQEIMAASAKATSFLTAADRYLAAHRSAWRNAKHRQQWENTLKTYAYPVMGSLSVAAIDTAIVMQAIEPLWSTKPETANRLRGRIESILDWATARGYRQGENPARWKGHLANLLPKKSKVRRVEHHAALPYAEIGSFVVELRQQDGIAARALEFAILTAGRTGEVLGARWDELNLTERLWIIPGVRMKAGKEHRVPLSERAIEILEEMATLRTGDYVFPGMRNGKPLSNMALLMTLRRMGRGDLTAHGFRSCFSDWCAEQTNFPAEVREMALAHTIGDKVEAAYRRGDLFQKRQQVMDAWAAFIEHGGATVVPFSTVPARDAPRAGRV
jgi:integrase